MKIYRHSIVLWFACIAAPWLAQAQVVLNQSPTRVLGQPPVGFQPANVNPNLVEGREFANPQALVLDTTANPPYLYVSDTLNNRVLGFRNAAAFANGQKADLVIGQPDFYTTIPQGPGGSRSTGLNSPFGLAVDAQGNLYVVDAGNNRILRFPKPFAQTGDVFPDLVIGQTSFGVNGPNGGVSTPSATGLFFSSPGVVAQAFITFDGGGNLWVPDAGNNRVLRFPVSSLGASAQNGPAADVVLGQVDFITGTYVNPSGNKTIASAVRAPTGIAFDPGGRLFVSESTGQARGRILVYTPPFTNGKPATRLLGVTTTTPAPPPISALELNAAPGNVFMIGPRPAIADSLNSRILIYAPFDQWTGDQLTQPAQSVIGQADFSTNSPNRRQPEAGAATLSSPASAFFSGTELFIADTGNNRVIVMPQSGAGFGPATRVLGQDQMNFNSINLVEGREFNLAGLDSGVIADLNSTPPHLYVSDTYNNRVLGYNDLRKVKPGDRADIVIGQPDFQHTVLDYPANQPTQSNLAFPTGLALDSAGNLYVADSANGRVLRFPRPFANPQSLPAADLVLGQTSFTGTITDATARTMRSPYGLAFAGDNGLLVSDGAQNRVLYFQGKAATLTSGMTATKVFGQPDFNTATAGTADNRMNAPHHIATDTDDRLYVTDTTNSRVLIFDRASQAGADPRPAVTLTGLTNPRGIYVSPSTGEIWVADTSARRAVRYRKFNDLAVNANPDFQIPSYFPLALTQDAFGDLYVADAASRVAIYFPGLAALNGANYCCAPGGVIVIRAVAPGAVAAVFSLGNANQFGSQTVLASSLPLPIELGGIQVLLNDQPVPLFAVTPAQINFMVPMNAPTSGTADLVIVRTDTGQVLGNSSIQMNSVAPGLFTITQTGSGQVAAINQDGTLNGADHPAPRSSVVSFYGTGQGVVPGAPPDGTAPSGAIPTPQNPQVIIGIAAVPPENVQYSGLAPGLPGVWQINVKIPDTVAPTTSSSPTQVVMVLNSIASGGIPLGRVVTMWVK